MKPLIFIIIVISFCGCNNSTDSIENSRVTNDSTSILDTLKGTIIYGTFYNSDYSAASSTVLRFLELPDFSRKIFKQFAGKRVSRLNVSPNTNEIVYTVEDYVTNMSHIVVSGLDSANKETILSTSDSSYNVPVCPSWTSDNKVAYLYGRSLSWQLKIQNDLFNVGKKYVGTKVSFSKDGARMYFSAYSDSIHSSLFSYDLFQHTTKLLVPADTSYSVSNIFDPAISPDDQTIVFTKSYANVTSQSVFIEGATEIWTVGINGNNPKMITQIGDPVSYPTWSPDGKKIAYMLNNQIFVINNDGTGKRKLSNDVVNSFCWIK